jgi:hypothetical protein
MPTAKDPLNRPECPKCGTQMEVARIVLEAPGFDRRTFECPMCEHSNEVVVPSNLSGG